MPPLSNLEVVGDARMEESAQGLIMVIPLRINVNLKSLTMDELKTRRKLLHLSMMDNLQVCAADTARLCAGRGVVRAAVCWRPRFLPNSRILRCSSPTIFADGG